MRVVEDQARAAFTRCRAADRGGDAVAGLIVLEALLGVLVARQPEHVAPALLIPRRLHEAPSLQVVADGQVARVGRAEELLCRISEPLPHGPHDADDRRLGVAGRNIDQQAVDLACADGLKMLADRLDVPRGDERDAWLNHVPGLPDELVEGR